MIRNSDIVFFKNLPAIFGFKEKMPTFAVGNYSASFKAADFWELNTVFSLKFKIVFRTWMFMCDNQHKKV